MLRYCTYVTVIDVFFAVQYMCVTSVCSGDYCHSSGDWPGRGLAELIAFLLCKGGKSELTTNAPGTEVPVTGHMMQYLSWFQPTWPLAGCDGSSNDISRNSALPHLRSCATVYSRTVILDL